MVKPLDFQFMHNYPLNSKNPLIYLARLSKGGESEVRFWHSFGVFSHKVKQMTPHHLFIGDNYLIFGFIFNPKIA